MTRPGPKTHFLLGPVKPRTVVLDDLTVTQAKVLGENLSDGIRKAVRTAFHAYQRKRDIVPAAAPQAADHTQPPGGEWHLTLLMAPHHLNLVVGEDRKSLLAYGRAVWEAGRLSTEVRFAKAAAAAGDVLYCCPEHDREPCYTVPSASRCAGCPISPSTPTAAVDVPSVPTADAALSSPDAPLA